MSVDRPGHIRVAKLIRNNEFNDRKYYPMPSTKKKKTFRLCFATKNRQSETETDQEKRFWEGDGGASEPNEDLFSAERSAKIGFRLSFYTT